MKTWLRTWLKSVVSVSLGTLVAGTALAQMATTVNVAQKQHPPGRLIDQIIDRMSTQEDVLVRRMRGLRPRIETYVQDVRPDTDLGFVPVNDHYFLGRLRFEGERLRATTFVPDPPSKLRRFAGPLDDAVARPIARLIRPDYPRDAFVRMMFPDIDGFDRHRYEFGYIRREFLGDIRCYVFDAVPAHHHYKGRFIGRIWIEDQNYNLVRFDGTFSLANGGHKYIHFDSWRVNTAPNFWVPAYIYTEESDMTFGLTGHARLRGQTRLWGYDLRYAGHQEELTDMTIEGQDVKDPDAISHNLSPFESSRAWERQAENNILERLEKAGLVSAEGEVDRVLDETLDALVVSNSLTIDPPVRCRVLLSTPLESFTVGHTIVLSRGLIDTLPDDASLAAVLAHELGHIVSGQQLDTRYAFSDRMLFPDEDSFDDIRLQRTPFEESQADRKAMEILMKSPYKDKLDKAGLYLRALVARAPGTPNLVAPHLGSRMFIDGYLQRLNAILASAPPLLPKRVDQRAALPLGTRIHMDPWSAHLTIEQPRVPVLLSPREKMAFQVTPFFPYLTRVGQVAKLQPTPTADAIKTAAP